MRERVEAAISAYNSGLVSFSEARSVALRELDIEVAADADPEIESVAQSVLSTPYFDGRGNEGTLDEVLSA